MSTRPPILTFAPAISPEAPDWLRQHLALIYSKLGSNAQAWGIQSGINKKITGVNSTTTIIEGLAGGGGGTGPIAGTVGGVADHSGTTSVTTVAGEYGSLLVLNDASPITVTLATQTPPWFCWATNLGAGAATLTPFSGTINGSASLVLSQYEAAVVAFDGTNWFAGSSPIFPQSFTSPTHEFVVSYSAATGLFAAAQPDFTDLTGSLAVGQLPANVPVVSFGSGAPVGSSTEGYIYFNTTAVGAYPYDAYVYHSGAWQKFS